MSNTNGAILNASADKKNVKTSEFIWYLIAVFFYTNMTGFVGQYRNAFLVDVVQITNKQSSLFSVVTSIVPFILNFFIVMYIDGRNIGKSGKFRPLVMLAAVPMGYTFVPQFLGAERNYRLAFDDLYYHSCRFVGRDEYFWRNN